MKKKTVQKNHETKAVKDDDGYVYVSIDVGPAAHERLISEAKIRGISFDEYIEQKLAA